MKNKTDKNIVYIIIATIVLLGLNGAVLIAMQQNKLDPPESMVLWGIFAILNVVSLIWAVIVLGLHPLLLAISYVAGGALAYFGVSDLAGVNMAEAVTAGAVYGGIGALTVGNVMVKMRTIFFDKGQVPFIFIVIALLVLDGVLNTKISNATWPVFLYSMVLPFGVAGLGLGTVGLAIVGGLNKKAFNKAEEENKKVEKKEKVVAAKPKLDEAAIAAKKVEAARVAAERVAADKAAVEKIEAQEKAEAEKIAAKRAEAERIAQEEKAAMDLAKLSKKEKLAAERVARKKAEAERIAAEEKAKAERIAAKKMAAAQQNAPKEEVKPPENIPKKESGFVRPANFDSKVVRKEDASTSSTSESAGEKTETKKDISSDWLSDQLNLLNKISKNENKDK